MAKLFNNYDRDPKLAKVYTCKKNKEIGPVHGPRGE